MRLLTLTCLLLLSVTLSAQDCLRGEDLLTPETLDSAPCVDYRTFLLLRDGTPYTVALAASADSVAVTSFATGSKPEREALPEVGTLVLISTATYVRHSTYTGTGWVSGEQGVTAWQPLPKPYRV